MMEKSAMLMSKINLFYLPKTDVAMASFKATSRDAVAAMLGTLIQSIIEQKILTTEEVLLIYLKAVELNRKDVKNES